MPQPMDRRRVLAGTSVLGLAIACPAIIHAQEPKTKIRIGLVPLISSGPIFIAQARKYFEKVNLDPDFKYFADGALAIPALVAGELDITASTLNGGVFNAVSKGAPYKLILDRGIEKHHRRTYEAARRYRPREMRGDRQGLHGQRGFRRRPARLRRKAQTRVPRSLEPACPSVAMLDAAPSP